VSSDDRQSKRLELFRRVSAERIRRLNLAWIDYETKRTDPTGFMREIHTLKGEAGLTDHGDVAQLAHLVESLVSVLCSQGGPPEQRIGDLVLRGLDVMGAMIAAPSGAANPESVALAAEIRGFLSPTAETPSPPAPEGVSSATAAASGPRLEISVRIASDKIDRMRSVVADMLYSHQRCRRAARDLRQLRERAQDLVRSLDVMQDEELSRGCGLVLDGLAGIESRLRDDSYLLSRVVGELDSATRELRMTPLGTLLERFPVPLRSLARSLGREVRMDTEGDQVEVDKTLLEMLEEPLLHLLRNAVDHGIEDPETRRHLGKPAEATLRVVARLMGPRLHLSVSDDGAGIDMVKVRQRAAVMGLLDPAQAEAASDEQVMRMIFAAGFSTRTTVSEVSGRGIGLNVVLDVLEGLGGSVDVTSKPGEGTRFDLYAPISVAISRVVLFRVGMGTYALPASSVRALVETRSLPALSKTEGPSVRYQGAVLPLLDLGKILGETHGTGSLSRIIIAQSGADLVALSGSSEHLEREVVLRPMAKFFERLRLVTSAVSLEDGSMAVVLKATELVLLARTLQAKARMAATQPMLVHGLGRTALVVDDSPVVRGIVADALRAYGLQVMVASDGEEALSLLDAAPSVDIVLTDMDMPRLDGLGLVRAMRTRDQNRDIPVVAISTKGSESEKRVALDAGVQAYIDKSDFNQALLWQTVSPFVVRS
jgi:two-component system, chemotaxis family, sensor kinase CheA